MKRRISAALAMLGLVAASFAGFTPSAAAAPDDPVAIPDTLLQGCIAAELKVTPAPIYTEAQLASVEYLSCNEGVDSLAGLEYATGLQYLVIYGGAVSDLTPAQSQALRAVHIQQTEVTDISPLAKLSALESVTLHQSKVSDFAPLRTLPQLGGLDIEDPQVHLDTATLAGLNLGWLKIWNSNISDLSFLTGMTSMESLSLRENKITDISVLATMPRLERLDLADNKVSDVTPLANATFAALNLENNEIIDASPLRNVTTSAAWSGVHLRLLGNRIADLSSFTTGNDWETAVYALNQIVTVPVVATAGVPTPIPVRGKADATKPLTFTLPAGVTRSGNNLVYSAPGTYSVKFSQITRMDFVGVPEDGTYFAGTFTQTVKEGTVVIVPDAPRITGTARVGYRLTAVPGTWRPAPVALSYQWLRNNVAISKATGSSYVLTAADYGKRISVWLTGTKTGAPSISKVSPASGVVAAGLLSAKTPTISGKARVKSTLRARVAAWGPAPVSLSYQWKRDGRAVKGATRTTYKLVKKDKKHRITVTVTGRKAGYTTVAKTSAKTAKVKK